MTILILILAGITTTIIIAASFLMDHEACKPPEDDVVDKVRRCGE